MLFHFTSLVLFNIISYEPSGAREATRSKLSRLNSLDKIPRPVCYLWSVVLHLPTNKSDITYLNQLGLWHSDPLKSSPGSQSLLVSNSRHHK